MNHSLNEHINLLQSNLSSLQHDKQTLEEQLQEQISKLKVRKEHLDHSLNEQINMLQSNLSSLQHDKQPQRNSYKNRYLN